MGWIGRMAIWTVVGLFFTTQTYVSHLYADRPIDWGQAALFGMSEWYLWALLFPSIQWAVRRFPLGTGPWTVTTTAPSGPGTGVWPTFLWKAARPASCGSARSKAAASGISARFCSAHAGRRTAG